jgi:hypothetical protein
MVIASRGKVDLDGQPARVGAAIGEGAAVRTGADGMVAIKLADGSTITVQSKSAIRLETARQFANTGGVSDSVIRLDAGRLETAVARQKGPGSRYEIRTPTSNMGVRGTVFRAAADDDGKRRAVPGRLRWQQDLVPLLRPARRHRRRLRYCRRRKFQRRSMRFRCPTRPWCFPWSRAPWLIDRRLPPTKTSPDCLPTF